MTVYEFLNKVMSRTRNLDAEVKVHIKRRCPEGAVTSVRSADVRFVGNFDSDNIVICIEEPDLKDEECF